MSRPKPTLPALRTEDDEMLEDLVTAGVNSALMNAKQKREEKMQEMTGGMNLPGIFP